MPGAMNFNHHVNTRIIRRYISFVKARATPLLFIEGVLPILVSRLPSELEAQPTPEGPHHGHQQHLAVLACDWDVALGE
jgi:hypothetical protein